ncbi:MAG TPA: FGGY family carbohydrate kinase [Candidatus Limnocylindria bacterium]|nr:FGGY family carbohydrate kinase [Candidatus Limnocylindria bacterium]
MLREPLAIPLREARAPLVLALDIGTSGLRVFLFDVRGRPIVRCIAHADRPVRTSADGEVTVDADERVRAACGAIDTVLASAGRRAGEIAAVATSTFWHSLVGVDARARPTTRVLTWADTRARGAAAALRRELDPIATHARTGCVLHASYLPSKLRWLREHESDAYSRTKWWMSLGEYLYLRILGVRRAGHGMASATGLYDQRARRWDRPLLSHLVVGEETLSPIDDAPLAGVLPTFARRWPALASATWVPAIGDGACSNVGAGAVGRDTASLFLGTSGAMRVVYATDDPPTVPGGWTYRLDASRVVTGGALSNGGNVLAWVARAFPNVDVRRALRTLLPDGPLVALPLLAGDRSPTWNDAARAAVVGIGLGTTSDDIARAMVEGVAHRVARLWDVTNRAIPGIERVVATGGTLLTLPWLIQLFADAIDRPLLMSAAGEGSARGAAITALERIGAIADITAVRSPLGRTFRPRPAVSARLRAGMERQRALEEALAPLMS